MNHKEELHTYRGDRSAYLLRSTMIRVKCRAENFPAHTTEPLEKGTVIIGNDRFGQYKGETQIILQSIKEAGRRNIEGKRTDESIEWIADLPPLFHL